MLPGPGCVAVLATEHVIWAAGPCCTYQHLPQPQPFVESRLSQPSPALGPSLPSPARGSRTGRHVCHLTPRRIQLQALRSQNRGSNPCAPAWAGKTAAGACFAGPGHCQMWAGQQISCTELGEWALDQGVVPRSAAPCESDAHRFPARYTLVHDRSPREGSLQPRFLPLTELGRGVFALDSAADQHPTQASTF